MHVSPLLGSLTLRRCYAALVRLLLCQRHGTWDYFATVWNAPIFTLIIIARAHALLPATPNSQIASSWLSDWLRWFWLTARSTVLASLRSLLGKSMWHLFLLPSASLMFLFVVLSYTPFLICLLCILILSLHLRLHIYLVWFFFAFLQNIYSRTEFWNVSRCGILTKLSQLSWSAVEIPLLQYSEYTCSNNKLLTASW